MTLLYTFLLFVLGLGISQADEYCNPFETCRAEAPDQIDDVPENAEDFDKFCEILVPFADCLLREVETCDPEPDKLEMLEKAHRLIMRVCSSDTLLNKAIRENMECIHRNIRNMELCQGLLFVLDQKIFQGYFESLSENGVTLTEKEIDGQCPVAVVVGSCMVATGGALCGDVVKAALIEIMQEGVNAFTACSEETLDKLNIVVDTLGPKMTTYTLPDPSLKE